jgi:nicotinamide-nucleotide amidase
MNIRNDILDISRQNLIGELSPWFQAELDHQIGIGDFLPESALLEVRDRIVRDLSNYRIQNGIHNVVLGMSGGVDSALTAALFKMAEWTVTGVTLPINQNPVETERGIEACRALGITHINKDLSNLYQATLEDLYDVDQALGRVEVTDKPTKIRRGNIRARLRMITLYNMAADRSGLVASTDNFSELGAGFWTLHGDVGDLSPIQSLLKSWEVPMLSKLSGVPEATWRATPTDGLGIDAGDEAQLGCSYLEWDLMVNAMINTHADNLDEMTRLLALKGEARASEVLQKVAGRMGASWFKRLNPVNIQHDKLDRYSSLAALDRNFFQPLVVR